ncbi:MULTISPECIES: hypothetical protein [Actinoplanes]|uniref:aggregation-promoting factor C-terminal-like domain-containing protein n=1 Tax=Actinoplanes TaxID=1865 RepID=UPI0005F2A0A7|nr:MULTISPECIES: hypothetical protein [Actinoplanes]GLY06960.1 hypothetical protein Acsp01_73390 [Actinoplanes sp. NBRC 101535]
MIRQWSRAAVRVASVGLLVAGTIAGVYVGQQRQTQEAGERSQLTAAATAEENRLLKERHGRQIAARAFRDAAEDRAAEKAATIAKTAATEAGDLEKKRKAKIEQEKKEKEAEEQKASGSVPFDGEIPASCSEFKGNRATGCALMLEKGFAIAEFPCLNNLWNKESGWNHLAENPNSGAYGIPQAFPGDKMGTIADDWRINAATQIKWGLGYIKGRYQSPCGAWTYWQNNHSY